MKAKKPSASVSDRPTQTTLLASSNTLSEVQLPFQEFQKLAGTLSETIAPSDLDTLNSALRYLFVFLREASPLGGRWSEAGPKPLAEFGPAFTHTDTSGAAHHSCLSYRPVRLD